MVKVCFLTKYHSNGASSRYRYYNYIDFLDKDIKVSYKPLLSIKYVENINKGKRNSKLLLIFSYLKRIIFILNNKKKFDLFIIEKELLPYFSYNFEKWLLKNVRYSLDFDDNAKTKYQNIDSLKNKIDKLVESADFVTVGNKWYFDDFSKFNNLHFLPTVVDVNKYKFEKDKNKKFSIVWIGSSTTSKYLSVVEEPLNRLADKKIEFQLVIIGGDNFSFNNAKFPVIYEKWNSETEGKNLSKCHLGIMPLYNTEWDEGKCGFKLIQYLAAGLPIIATKTIANSDIVKKSKVGIIANTNEEWENAFVHFYLDFKSGKDYTKDAKRVVEENYSYQVAGKYYSNLIKKYGGE